MKIGNANGNETSDAINQNYAFVYDNRNLLIEFKNSSSPNVTFRTRYYYDEAGNRIRKLVAQGSGTGGVGGTGGDEIDNWSTMLDEFYVRDLNGKEIAIYQNGNLTQWNLWGLDNFGKINSDGSMFFYLKDHLGSVHAVVDASNNVVSAQDYDAWGQIIPERQWVQSTDQSIYKFTSKERDAESNYDYFGARYYDSRIARWGGVEPKYNKYLTLSPYVYALNNPLKLSDETGNDAHIEIKGNDIYFRVNVYYISAEVFPEEEKAIDDNVASKIGSLIEEAQENWNNATDENGKMNYGGNEYTPHFEFNLIPIKTEEMLKNFGKGTGDNYLEITDVKNPAVIQGNKLRILWPNSAYILPEHWLEHEFGHLMGLLHPTEDIAELKYNTDVMGYNKFNNKPCMSNTMQIMKNIIWLENGLRGRIQGANSIENLDKK